jgi:dienelactone hydrolase
LVILLTLACAAKEVPAPAIVDLTAVDKIKLKATYFAAAEPGPGILLLHQCNRQRKVWDELAHNLAAAGFHVLTLDYRGYGESEGAPHEKGVEIAMFPADVDVAFQYLASRPGVRHDSIGVGGASCSVNQSVQAARRHSEIKALMLLSGDTGHDGRTFLRASTNLPLFISVADDDGHLAEFMQWLFNLSASPSSNLVHYAIGGHGVELFTAHKELPGEIVEWFEATLMKKPRSGLAIKHATPMPDTGIFDLIDDPPDGVAKAAKILAQARQRNPNAVLFSESLANRIGTERMEANDVRGALEIFKLNVTAYPTSPNAYDRLADAYLSSGESELAEKTANKAIALLATDTTDSAARRDAIRASAEKKVGISDVKDNDGPVRPPKNRL